MYASACIKGRSAGVQNKNPCLQKQTGVFNILSTVSTMIITSYRPCRRPLVACLHRLFHPQDHRQVHTLLLITLMR